MDYEKLAETVMIPEGAPTGRRAGPGRPPGPFPAATIPERFQGLAAAKGYDQENGPRLHTLRYSHEAMIDVIIAEPTITQIKLAERFGMSQHWICRILGSDAFQAAMAIRREEIIDPFLIATIEERFRGLAMQSLDVIAENLEKTRNSDIAMKALDISSKALGFGARAPATNNQQNNFVIQLPAKAASAEDWSASHTPIIEHKG